MDNFRAVVGIVVLLAVWIALSENRSAIRWRVVGAALALQAGLALLFLKVPGVADAFLALNTVVQIMEQATRTGAEFVLGFLAGDTTPWQDSAGQSQSLYILAFRVLPQVLVFSALVAVLWHWRVLQLLVRGFAWALTRTLGIGGAVGTAAASSIFLGMIEMPLLIRAYLSRLRRAELFTVMSLGMATVAGAIMVLYATVLGPQVPGVLGHILAASILNVVGTLLLAELLVPGDANVTTAEDADLLQYSSTMDAITQGTTDGLSMAASIGAMLIVLVSLIALLNILLGKIFPGVTLELLLGSAFAPASWLIGIPWSEASAAGSLLGTKLVLNELIAFFQLAALPEGTLSARSTLIMTYALCGFANFGSLGIMLGGLNTLVPERRQEILELSLKSVGNATGVALLTGALIAVISW